jgi:hypothetical protein
MASSCSLKRCKLSSIFRLSAQRTIIKYQLCILISVKRERKTGEVIPVSATMSGTYDEMPAKNAIDLDWNTYSYSSRGSDGAAWLKLTLDRVYCVTQATAYYSAGYSSPGGTWTCSKSDCSPCSRSDAYWCSRVSLTVSIERATSNNLTSYSDCRYGDTVKIEEINDEGPFIMYEIVIQQKQCEIKH